VRGSISSRTSWTKWEKPVWRRAAAFDGEAWAISISMVRMGSSDRGWSGGTGRSRFSGFAPDGLWELECRPVVGVRTYGDGIVEDAKPGVRIGTPKRWGARGASSGPFVRPAWSHAVGPWREVSRSTWPRHRRDRLASLSDGERSLPVVASAGLIEAGPGFVVGSTCAPVMT